MLMSSVSVASIALPLADANHHTFSSDSFALLQTTGEEAKMEDLEGKELESRIQMVGIALPVRLIDVELVVVMLDLAGVALGNVAVVVFTAVYQA